MKNIFDFTSALFAIIVLFGVMVLIAMAIKLSSKGPVLYWSKRVGQNNIIFNMPKFRTMQICTPSVATHLLSDPEKFLTPIGGFLRRTSLDELPQLFSILEGSMSFVGPRPALFNQDDLINLRSDSGISRLKPGVTGWAQINGRDDLSIQKKVEFEKEYLKKMSFVFDLKIIWLTFFKVFKRDGISH